MASGRPNLRPAPHSRQRPLRALTAEEAALWARLAETVTPLEPRRRAMPVAQPEAAAEIPPPPPRWVKGRVPPPLPPPPVAPATRPLERHGLDAGWDKRLAKGMVSPDFSLDLHGFTLDEAYARLDHGLTLARSQGARLVLLITGRPRPQGSARGAIRARVADWLALGPHGSAIAAVRGAHLRHGGAGALYIVLKRQR